MPRPYSRTEWKVTGSPHPSGQHRAHSNADDRGDVEQGEKHYNKEVACDDDVPPGEGQ
jgi:hypothetical protein